MNVSVVIPTTLRQELLDALRSVETQRLGRERIEIIVVVDGPESAMDGPMADALSGVEKIIFTGGGAGAPAARNLGVQHSTGVWIAFLDDDDYWLPSKLSEQVAAASSLARTNSKIVIACRVQQTQSSSEALSVPVPSRCLAQGDDVARYLFERRRPSLGRSSIFTSTLLVDAELARSVPWDESLKRHQDWDWLIKAQAAGAGLHQLTEVLSIQRVGSSGSISASNDWRSSLRWAESWKDKWSPNTYVDFIAGQPLRYALQARSLAGVRSCIREVYNARKLPSVGPAIIAGAGILSRRHLERLLVPQSRTRQAGNAE